MQRIIDQVPPSVLSVEKKKLLAEALASNEPQYSVRLNKSKFNVSLNLKQVEWCDHAFFIESKPRFSMDPLWHAGTYYVQEAGSMFLDAVIKALPFESAPTLALDLCAAPGGKTLLLADALPSTCVLVANEILPLRFKSLHENVIKWGTTNIVTTNSAPTAFEKLGDAFDVILVDAPCSGEGLLRRHDEALNQWTPELVEECCYRQKQILTSALACLKPGGFLIYSTCTYNTRENEENLKWLIEENNCLPVELKLTIAEGITVTETCGNKAYRFFPGITQTEGFFMTVVQKEEDSNGKNKHVKPLKIKQASNPVKGMIDISDNCFLADEKGILKFYNTRVYEAMQQLAPHVKIMDAGRDFGSVKNGKFIPAETLGFSNGLNIHDDLIANVNYEDAIRFLSRADFKLPSQKKGYAFVSFENIRLGLVNVLDNRVNNYYPNHWRILNPDVSKAFRITDFV